MRDFGETLRTLTAITLLAIIVTSSYIGATVAVSLLSAVSFG